MILYETLNQPLIFLYVIICGFLSGLLFDVANIIVFLCNKNKIVRFFCDFLSTITCCFVVYLITNHLNYGEFRFYVILFFCAFLTLERFTLGKFIAKFNDTCYTVFKKFASKLTKENNNGTNKKEK